VISFAGHVQAKPTLATAGLVVWAIVEGALVFAGLSTLPGISLVLGGLGALAVIAIAALLAKAQVFNALRFAGENSIAVYLAFFLPMAITRTIFLKLGFIHDIGTVSAIVTMVATIAPLLLFMLVRGTWASFLFERPKAFRLEAKRSAALQPAE
jgi:uncharacterized membrane protein YcfT